MVTAIAVFCSYVRCSTLLATGKPRYIGEDGGAGGKWPCKACGHWTGR